MVRAAVCRERGQLARADRMLAELEPKLRRMLPAGHIAFASLASEQGLLAEAHGNPRRALAAANEALEAAERSPQGRSYLPLLLLRRSHAELGAGRPEEARADAERALRMERETAEPGTFSSGLGQACLALSRALRALGRLDEARATASSALEQLEPTLGIDHPEAREARRLTTSAGRTR
jgi:tetratricopeptide (TPR) repeat protein